MEKPYYIWMESERKIWCCFNGLMDLIHFLHSWVIQFFLLRNCSTVLRTEKLSNTTDLLIGKRKTIPASTNPHSSLENGSDLETSYTFLQKKNYYQLLIFLLLLLNTCLRRCVNYAWVGSYICQNQVSTEDKSNGQGNETHKRFSWYHVPTFLLRIWTKPMLLNTSNSIYSSCKQRKTSFSMQKTCLSNSKPVILSLLNTGE